MQQDLNEVKKYLLERKEHIEERLTAIKQEDPFSDTERLSDNAASDTEAREEMGHERAETLKEELTASLTQVTTALEKVASGKYGTCDNCGKQIEPERLKAFPMAQYCLACEKLMEEKKK